MSIDEAKKISGNCTNTESCHGMYGRNFGRACQPKNCNSYVNAKGKKNEKPKQ